MVGHVELALVLRGIVVRVTDKRALPLIGVSTDFYISVEVLWTLTWSWNLFQEKVSISDPDLASSRPS